MTGKRVVRVLLMTILPIVLAAASGFVITASLVMIGAGLKTALWSGLVGGVMLSATIFTMELLT